jgi:phosphoglycerate kinase
MNKKSVRDVDVGGKRVLVRVDLNVPLDEDTGAISDFTRIRAVLPTIQYLIDKKSKVILCSHMGRPKGKVVPELSLAQVADHLSKLLGKPVAMASDCVGAEVEQAAAGLQPGEVLMLENLRFHAEEENNDPQFAQSLSRLADIYVNDAFGTAHRKHASTEGIAHYLPAVAGLLLEREIDMLSRVINTPTRPLAAIIGGAKISDKIGVIEHILDKVDSLLVIGGMAATFFKAQGYSVGASMIEEDMLDLAKRLIGDAAGKGVNLLLPQDVVVAERFAPDAKHDTVAVADVPAGWFIMDIGPRTIALFESELRKCKTVVWNGPAGVFEYPAFSKGTTCIAELLAGLDATTVIGGGSTAEAVEELGLSDRMSHVSTGGGASLKLLEGKALPGVEILQDKEVR